MVQDIKEQQTPTAVDSTATAEVTAPQTSDQVITTKEPIVTTIQEAPVVEKIIEQKDIEKVHKNVIEEIHVQPIVEIERHTETQIVQQQPVENVVVQPTRYEEVGTSAIPQQQQVAPTTIPSQPITQETIQQGMPLTQGTTALPTTAQQPLSTQQLGTQPLPQQGTYTYTTTTITEGTGTTQQPVTQQFGTQPMPQQGTVTSTGLPTTQSVQPDHIRIVRSGSLKTVYGLSYGGELFTMHKDKRMGLSWERFTYWPNAGPFRFLDFSVIKKGFLYLIGLEDRRLYFMDPTVKVDGMLRPLLTNLTTYPRLKSVSAYGPNHAYLLAEDGSIYLYDNDKLNTVNGQLKAISCGDPGRKLFAKHHFEMWGIGFDDIARRWNRVDNWEPINIPLLDVSVGRDNSVFAINREGQLIKWNDKTLGFEACQTKSRSTGGNHPTRFAGVSVLKEKHGVYCTDNMGNVYTMDL